MPFATVVTDLTTCHNTWFHPLVDRCFVPTLYCKRSAMKNGLKEEQAWLDTPIALFDLLHDSDIGNAPLEDRWHTKLRWLYMYVEAMQRCRSLCMVCPSGLHSARGWPQNTSFVRDSAWTTSCPLSCLWVSPPLQCKGPVHYLFADFWHALGVVMGTRACKDHSRWGMKEGERAWEP